MSQRDPSARPLAVALRAAAGVALLVALALIALALHSTVDANPQASAVQIVQVYTQSLYQVVIAIGAAIGLYIASRALD